MSSEREYKRLYEATLEEIAQELCSRSASISFLLCAIKSREKGSTKAFYSLNTEGEYLQMLDYLIREYADFCASHGLRQKPEEEDDDSPSDS